MYCFGNELAVFNLMNRDGSKHQTELELEVELFAVESLSSSSNSRASERWTDSNKTKKNEYFADVPSRGLTTVPRG